MMYTEHVVSSTCRKKKLFHDRSSVNLRSLLRQTARQSYRRQHAVGNGKLDVTLLRLHSDTEPESHSTVDSLKLPVDIQLVLPHFSVTTDVTRSVCVTVKKKEKNLAQTCEQISRQRKSYKTNVKLCTGAQWHFMLKKLYSDFSTITAEVTVLESLASNLQGEKRLG